ncbi:MAG: RNase H family protein [Polyangiales bacterium]
MKRPTLREFKQWLDPNEWALTSEDLARAERHRAKGYEEHESYPIELDLPRCAFCAGVAARCACPSVELGIGRDGYAAHACAPDTPVEAWTDGSGNTADRPGGAGVVIARGGVVLAEWSEGIDRASNNSAEVWAIGRALQLVQESWGSNVRLVVFSDSQWAIGAIDPHCTWRLDASKRSSGLAIAARKRAAAMSRLTFQFVKGHTGLPFNERADELAGDARKRLIARTKIARAA